MAPFNRIAHDAEKEWYRAQPQLPAPTCRAGTAGAGSYALVVPATDSRFFRWYCLWDAGPPRCMYFMIFTLNLVPPCHELCHNICHTDRFGRGVTLPGDSTGVFSIGENSARSTTQPGYPYHRGHKDCHDRMRSTSSILRSFRPMQKSCIQEGP